MKNRHFIILLGIIFSFAMSLTVDAKPKPRWVRKGVKELNNHRSNTTYEFHIFEVKDNNQPRFEWNQFSPLLNYIDSF